MTNTNGDANQPSEDYRYFSGIRIIFKKIKVNEN